jgi:DinB family protein/SCP-2 sterol transfer family protein
MGVPIAQDQWEAVRVSLKDTGDRFATMVSSVPGSETKATGEWSVAETAAHVAAIGVYDTTLIQPGAEVPIPGFAERAATASVDGVNDLNGLVLRHFSERDAKVLAQLLQDVIGQLLADSNSRDPAETVTWLGGSQLPLAGLVAHLLNELLIHGRDIALAVRAPWVIPPRDAAQFFELFFVPLAGGELGHLLDGGDRPRARRIAVEFRSDYTTRVTLALQNGKVSVEPPGQSPDARVSFDPVTLNLMMFGRVSRLHALATRKVVIRGRRPWLLPVFLRKVRVP